jgi:ketosteroid isomerase-like protein
MHPNAELITRFYTALSKLDGAAMAACYAPGASFADPVFPGLKNGEPGKMWRMLTTRGKDMTVVFDGIEANDANGKAHWVATYTFSGTGARVVNDIQARFTFENGLIKTHQDQFDLYKWMRQALGLKGILLGWLPPVQAKLQKTARAGLDAFKG